MAANTNCKFKRSFDWMGQPNITKVYKQIAKKNGISVAEVKREIQEAIKNAYDNPNFYARCIPCTNGTPTPEEFIAFMADKISVRK